MSHYNIAACGMRACMLRRRLVLGGFAAAAYPRQQLLRHSAALTLKEKCFKNLKQIIKLK